MANFDWLSVEKDGFYPQNGHDYSYIDLRVQIINNTNLIVFNVLENVFIRAVKVALNKFFSQFEIRVCCSS